jgi:hypothetical protein
MVVIKKPLRTKKGRTPMTPNFNWSKIHGSDPGFQR